MNGIASLSIRDREDERQRTHPQSRQHSQQHLSRHHLHLQHLALRVASDGSQRLHQQQLDLSPAFSEDVGPPSLPSSSPPSPTPHLPPALTAAFSSSQHVPPIALQLPRPSSSSHHDSDDNQQQQQSAVMQEAVAEMKQEMERLMREVEAKDSERREKAAQASTEVERLQAELRKLQDERQEWLQERERLLDLSNRLQAELRKERSRQQQQQQQSALDAAWRERLHAVQDGGRDADSLRAALQRLIEQNRQLSADIRQLTLRPASPSPSPPPSSVQTETAAATPSLRLPASTRAAAAAPSVSAGQHADGELDGNALLHLVGTRASLGSRESAAAADTAPSRQQQRATAAVRLKLKGRAKQQQDLTGKIRNYAIHESGH